ncbi:hypothetical protein ACGF5M_00125 [Gemmatimonadota bacterium]
MLTVYYGHPVDGLSRTELENGFTTLHESIAGIEHRIVNEEFVLSQFEDGRLNDEIPPSIIVDTEIEMMKTSDIFVVDFLRQPHFYIGCLGELIYSKIFDVPSIALVDNANAGRPWLQYHATRIIAGYADVERALRDIIAI